MDKTTTRKNASSLILGAITYVLTSLPYLFGTMFILQELGYGGLNWVSVPTYIGAGILHLITVLAASTIIHTAS